MTVSAGVLRLVKPTGAQTRAHSASRRELVVLGLYFLFITLAADVLNVRLGIEAMTAVVAGAAIFITRTPRAFFQDWWFVLVALVLWNLSSAVAANSPFPAHLDFLMQGDRLLFLGHDPVVLVQGALAPRTGVNILDWVTAIAYNLHLGEPYVAGYFLWRMNRALYFQFVASVLILLLVGFLTFIFWPSVPPWMANIKLHRIPSVTNRFGPILNSYPLPFHGTPIFYLFHLRGDAVAAFPSEHAAFPMLELLAFARLSRPFLTSWLVVWVGVVLFTIVYLGEHWITDALAAYACAIIVSGSVARVCSRSGTRVETARRIPRPADS